MIIDVFTWLFKADTSKLESGINKAEKSADKLTESLDESDKSAKELSDTFKDVAKSIIKIAASYKALAIIKQNIIDTAKLNAELETNSRILGVNASDIAAWSGGIVAAGGSAQGLTNTLRSLHERYAMMGMGARVPKIFDILPKLANRMASMDKNTAFAFGKRLGLDEGTILLLQKGRAEVEKIITRQKELAQVTKEDAQTARAFAAEQNNLKSAFKSLYTSIGGDVLPSMTGFYKIVEDIIIFLREHKGFMYSLFIGLGAVLYSVVIPSFAALATTILTTLVPAFAATNVAMAPLILSVAAYAAIAAAIGLIVDEIYNWVQGGDSLISRFIGPFSDFEGTLKAIGNAFEKAFVDTGVKAKEIWDSVMSGIDTVAGFFGIDVGGDKTGVKSAGQSLATAGSSPLASMSSSSITNNAIAGNSDSKSKSFSLSTGPISIVAEGSNSQEIASSIKGDLDEQMKLMVAGMDDGMAL